MSEELKPCPHCGERDELYPAYRSMAHDGKLADAPYAIDCLGCGSDFTPRAGMDARAAWNRRSPDPRLAMAREALKPFADIAEELENEPAWAGVLEHDHPLAGRVSVADFRRARATLTALEEGK